MDRDVPGEFSIEYSSVKCGGKKEKGMKVVMDTGRHARSGGGIPHISILHLLSPSPPSFLLGNGEKGLDCDLRDESESGKKGSQAVVGRTHNFFPPGSKIEFAYPRNFSNSISTERAHGE
jgi:hypothetical protein